MTVSISIERYLSICHSHNTCNGKSLLLILPIIFAILYNIPKFFELLACDVTQINIQNSTNYTIGDTTANIIMDNDGMQTNNSAMLNDCTPEGLRATPMRKNPWYIIFYSVLSKLLLVEIIPWVAVIVFNYLIWKKIREFQATRERLMKNSPNQGNQIYNLTKCPHKYN